MPRLVAVVASSPASGASRPIAAAVLPTTGPLALNISVDPGTICAYGTTSCAAGTGTARVTLTAAVPSSQEGNWTQVQVVFVLETLPYDGAYDPTAGDVGFDPCAKAYTNRPLCEESNGVPLFLHNASQIAASIQAAHPGTTVGFALVDQFSTCDFDDCDGHVFHVDVGNFTSNATLFGSQVNNTFGVYAPTGSIPDSDASDNLLHSSSITAIYGAMAANSLNWSNASHHVVVWIGDGAPRDRNYTQNYCVSPSAWASSCSITNSSSYSPGCEPSFAFASGSSPACLGWVTSQSGNSSQSLAAVARQSANCANSPGGACTIDTIDLWSTPTDPNSYGWRNVTGGGPNSTIVRQNVQRVLTAGCDLANATNGSWDGPSFFTCPNGVNGTLHFAGRSNAGGSANWTNPTLYDALSDVSFGGPRDLLPVPERPAFEFVPYGNISLANPLNGSATCSTPSGPFPDCQSEPVVTSGANGTMLGWNWSSVGGSAFLTPGDTWTASFDVQFHGAAATGLPVEACRAEGCAAVEAGSGATSGVAVSLWNGTPPVLESFPLATLNVEAPAPLLASAIASPTSVVVGEPVQFHATVSNAVAPVAYRWAFGDHGAASGIDVSHSYASAGRFIADLTVSDGIGRSAGSQVTVFVGAPASAPSVSLSIDRSVTTVDRPVRIVGIVSGASAPFTYSWSGLPSGCADDGLATLQCTPTASGTYSVQLSVTDAAGQVADNSIGLLVNGPVRAGFSVAATGACGASPIPVSFFPIVAGGTPPYSYSWIFGDGTPTSSATSPVHPYATPGPHTVTLAVTDSVGAMGNVSEAVGPAVESCGSSTQSSVSAWGTAGPLIVIGSIVAGVGIVAAVVVLPRLRPRP